MIQKPINTTTGVSVSERVCQASAIMATEPETIPTQYLRKNKKVFRKTLSQPSVLPKSWSANQWLASLSFRSFTFLKCFLEDFYLTCFQAFHAHVSCTHFSIWKTPVYALQVGYPTAIGSSVGVAHIMTERGSFSTDRANSCHIYLLLIRVVVYDFLLYHEMWILALSGGGFCTMLK